MTKKKKLPKNVHVVEMDPNEDIEFVFKALGILHQSQIELFRRRDITLATPGFDLEDYDVHLICVDVPDEGSVKVGAMLGRESGCFGQTYTLSDIVILPEWRGIGLASTALEWFLQRAENEGYRFVNLNVHADNEPARNLYRSAGFEPTSIHMTRRLK